MYALLLSIILRSYEIKWFIFGLAFFHYVAWRVGRAWGNLARFEGPWLAQLSDLWLLKTIYQQRAHYVFYDIKKKYG